MISVVYDVGLYRSLLVKCVQKGDIVIEIGPHTGKSTLGYVSNAGLVIALDKSPEAEKSFKKLAREHRNLRFMRKDVRGFEAIKKVLQLTPKCDVLAVDLGGGRFSDTVYKVWACWSGVFKPKHSIIRSRALAEFIQKVKVEDNSVKKKFADDGWLSTWGRATPYALRKQLDEFKHYVDIKKRIKDED
ncbi:MAG: SAM-dependent methyltransferase [Candidatus Altiarchaeales archaeon]|nr:SAM-dependent methyltransferase [Candidatus Altiarchaeales archaeon]